MNSDPEYVAAVQMTEECCAVEMAFMVVVRGKDVE